jgi:hypothetical protein
MLAEPDTCSTVPLPEISADVPKNDPVKLDPLIARDELIIVPSSISPESPMVVEVVNLAIVFVVPGPTVPAPPGAHDADIANDEVVANDADVAQLLVPINVPVNEPVKLPVNGAVSDVNCVELDTIPFGNPVGNTYEDVMATLALFAQLLVPINCPVNDPVNDPVLI